MNDKSFFVISANNPALLNASSLFIADPFIKHLIDINPELAPNAQLHIGSFVRQGPDDLYEANNLVWSKYQKYIPIISKLLNNIHNSTFSDYFWRSAFSMGLVRHLTLMYDFFMICETQFNHKEHNAYKLAIDCFHIPFDYNEQRWFLQHSHFGQEQLFSMYLNMFYPMIGLNYSSRYKSSYQLDRIISRTGDYNPSVGVMGSLCNDSRLQELQVKSNGTIAPIGFDIQLPRHSIISYARRTNLNFYDDTFDRFDKFFFGTLPFMLPQEFIENFSLIFTSVSNQFDRYTNLKYVVSETFIGETYESIALAILKNRGVSVVYSEHNYCESPCYASILEQQASFVDIFASHGNYYAPIKNKVSTGSLFHFFEMPLAHDERTIEILYICGLAEAKYAYFSHTFMLTAEHALDHYDFKLRFFNSLPANVLKKIVYRPYPKDPQWALTYNDQFIMGQVLSSMYIDNLNVNGRERIRASRLVIVDYLATAYLESLSMNIPTVIFYNKNTYFFNDNSKDFLDDLLNVGICQDDPEKAAKFIEQISLNPEAWWFQTEVQAAKDRFLERNLGKPEYLANFLMDLAAGIKQIKFDNIPTDHQMKTKLSNFKYEEHSRVFLNCQNESAKFAYSDGNEVEERIYRILKETEDLGLFSRELCRRITDWPTEYHFSPMRHNLLRHIKFKKADRVLELGCGCGAISRQIGESGANTTSIEGSLLRAKCAAERCRDLNNVKVYCSNFQDVGFKPEYDYVTLIGVLEYSSMFFVGDEPFKQCLDIAKSALKKGGKLIIAIENRLGLKYFLGYSEDHTSNIFDGIQDFYDSNTACTFGKQELTDLLIESGFKHIEFAYPFPDYKLPSVVIFNKGMKTKNFSVSDIISQVRSRDYSYPERKLPSESFIWQQLETNGLLEDLSNSFLVEASFDELVETKSTLAKYYTVDRKREYNTETTFELNSVNIKVLKKKLEKGFYSTNMVVSHELCDADYIPGHSMQFYINKAIASNKFNDFISYFKKWLVFILENGLERVHPENVFQSSIRGSFVDAKPKNIVLNDGKLVLIDTEWRYNKESTVYSLIIRYLSDLDLEFIDLNVPGDGAPAYKLFELLGIAYDDEIYKKYISLENEISSAVFDGCYHAIHGK